jgi:Mrp family chromosome partitioning ATPase
MINKEQMDTIGKILDQARSGQEKTYDVAEFLFREIGGEGYNRSMCENAVRKYMQGVPLERIVEYLDAHLKIQEFLYSN